jgi:predicted nucleic acid-binding protein
MTAAEATAAILDLQKLALISTPTQLLATEALAIAGSLDVTAYDACYLALSDRFALPLVTADEALVRKAGGSHLVRWLGSMTPPSTGSAT